MVLKHLPLLKQVRVRGMEAFTAECQNAGIACVGSAGSVGSVGLGVRGCDEGEKCICVLV